jgi:hypothetical protein
MAVSFLFSHVIIALLPGDWKLLQALKLVIFKMFNTNWRLKNMFKPFMACLLIFSGVPFAKAEDPGAASELVGDVRSGKGPIDWVYEAFIFQGGAEVDSPIDSMTGLAWKDNTKLLVQVVAVDENAETLLAPALEATNFESTGCSQYMCAGWLPMENYPDLKAREEVKAIRPLFRTANQAGAKVSEALDSLRVDLVRLNLDSTLDGTGLRIGILSDSFDNSDTASTSYADDVASGDLPGDVTILKEFSEFGTDEGRGMAQLIHDLIPGADISFYTAAEGPADFANGIQALADEGCDVIVDDIGTYSKL